MSGWKFVKEEVARRDSDGRFFNAERRRVYPFRIPDGLVEQLLSLVIGLMGLLEGHSAHILGDSEWEDVVIRLNARADYHVTYKQIVSVPATGTESVGVTLVKELELTWHDMLVGKFIREER